MRILIASLAATLIAGLAVSADAAPSSKKKRHVTNKDRISANTRRNDRQDPQFGYDATPEHYQVGTREWWRAMEREGRGGFGDTP